MPTDYQSQRHFLDLRSGLRWPVAARPGQWPVLSVGRFQFSPAAFAWANAALRGAATDPAVHWLVVDEIGPLELRGEGLAPALTDVLRAASHPDHLIIVVRSGLVEAVWRRFKLHRWPMSHFGNS
ncbi:nucleoside-triphosphatase [Hymenobacter sp. 15J16-1T3B]|nr:nucleoside-triphosphatase [Hymenobacter sp. 15J16-1T3B]MCC3158364.1 nucleoside-triphosphatase [Hymenobacter sp. 15J16-1T3B]